MFSDIFPATSAQIDALRQQMDQACRKAVTDLMNAFFQDYPNVRSVYWEQPLGTDGNISIANMSCDFHLFAQNEPLLVDLGNLNQFIDSIRYHMQCVHGANVSVRLDRNGATVNKLA